MTSLLYDVISLLFYTQNAPSLDLLLKKTKINKMLPTLDLLTVTKKILVTKAKEVKGHHWRVSQHKVSM